MKKFIDFLPNATGGDVVTWLKYHKPNPKRQPFKLKNQRVGGSKKVMKLITKYYKSLPSPLS